MSTPVNSSNAAGKPCEPCMEGGKCLAHVELVDNNQKTSQKYYWKDGNGALKCPGINLVFMSTEKKKVIPIQWEIKNSDCQNNPKHKDCCTLYVYEAGHTEKPIKEVEAKGKETTLQLEFNEEYLAKGTELVPHYVTTDHNMKLLSVSHDYGVLTGNIGTTTGSSSVLEQTLRQAVAATGWTFEKFKGFLLRTTGFVILGTPYAFPASRFHAAAIECGFADAMTLDPAKPSTYRNFDSAVADIYILPYYETVVTFEIKPPKIKSLADFAKVISGIELNIELEETIQGQLKNKITLNVLGVIDLIKSGCAAVFYKNTLMAIALDFFDKIHGFEQMIPKPVSQVRGGGIKIDPVIGFSGQLPIIKLTVSNAKTAVEDGMIQIKRENCKVDLECGFEVYVNLIQLFINAIPPLLAAYATAKGFLTSLSVIGVNADISTNRNSELNNEGSWAAASLIIYADFGVELKETINMGLDTERFGFVPIPTCENLKTDIIPSLQAGASFKAEILIFTGGVAANLQLYSKFLLEILQVDRKDEEGNDVKEWGYYLAFMGLGVKWSISGSVGLKIQTEERGKGGMDNPTTRNSRNIGELGYENGNDHVLMGNNTANSTFKDTEWQEFEKRDQEIANLLRQIEAMENEHKRLNRPTAGVTIARNVPLIGDIEITWKSSERNQELRALRNHIEALRRQKKEYENLQDKSDTAKIWGSSILTHQNLNAEELTKIRQENKIN